MQLRHELKHSLNYADYLILRSRLAEVLPRDEHVDQYGEYKVRSLYFDNIRDKALMEKLDGVDEREKFAYEAILRACPQYFWKRSAREADSAINLPPSRRWKKRRP